MRWPANTPISKKDDFFLNAIGYVNEKDLKVEASLAITFAIAEADYKTAEDTAFSWIYNDYFHNKLGKARIIENFLMEYLKFTNQAINREIQKILQKTGENKP